MSDFNNRVAIVTGGASGIGRMLCEELSGHGASVVVADINVKESEQVAAFITKNGGRARSAHLDVTDAEAVQNLINEIAKEYGRLDYMFNNAGIAVAGEIRDLNLDHWRRIMD